MQRRKRLDHASDQEVVPALFDRETAPDEVLDLSQRVHDLLMKLKDPILRQVAPKQEMTHGATQARRCMKKDGMT